MLSICYNLEDDKKSNKSSDIKKDVTNFCTLCNKAVCTYSTVFSCKSEGGSYLLCIVRPRHTDKQKTVIFLFSILCTADRVTLTQLICDSFSTSYEVLREDRYAVCKARNSKQTVWVKNLAMVKDESSPMIQSNGMKFEDGHFRTAQS